MSLENSLRSSILMDDLALKEKLKPFMHIQHIKSQPLLVGLKLSSIWWYTSNYVQQLPK